MFDISMDWSSGLLSGRKLNVSRRTLADLKSLFRDQSASEAMPPETLLYEVQSYQPEQEGTEGGLFWGNTTLYPGTVGDEYFMTKGHFHSIGNRGEFYVTCKGEGALLLMAKGGPTVSEKMSVGSVHYIPGHHAHRVANTGNEPLVFIACWPSDAGYDYSTIEKSGFSSRLLKRDEGPTMVPQE
jgi:glucose-6-phosphate isomerase